MASDTHKIPFGLSMDSIRSDDSELTRQRILEDIKSDFILAPHISSIFRRNFEHVYNSVSSDLKNGKFAPYAPITMEVPKATRMRVSSAKRFGPAFSRPGSILLPKDRVFYQILGNIAAPILEKHVNRDICFSQQLQNDDPEMFAPSRESWNELQKEVEKKASADKGKYIIKLDVNDYFSTINLHILINYMSDIGYPAPLVKRLETILTRFTGDRSSRGIIQGLYTSDLLGNFYLSGVDQELADMSIPHLRYVDDMYVFVDHLSDAEVALRTITQCLRNYDLGLNESKSYITTHSLLLSEEPDLDEMFRDAVDEIEAKMDDDDNYDLGYGILEEWDDEDDEPEWEPYPHLEMHAVRKLFDAISEYPAAAENIERFCLPLFSKFKDDYAIDYVVKNVRKKPSMAQIYASYLANYTTYPEVSKCLTDAITADDVYFDWQRMWLAGALLKQHKLNDDSVSGMLQLFKDNQRHDALRAICALCVAKFGSYKRRKSLNDFYENVGSAYLQTALLYGAGYAGGTEKSNALMKWRGQSELHEMVSKVIE